MLFLPNACEVFVMGVKKNSCMWKELHPVAFNRDPDGFVIEFIGVGSSCINLGL